MSLSLERWPHPARRATTHTPRVWSEWPRAAAGKRRPRLFLADGCQRRRPALARRGARSAKQLLEVAARECVECVGANARPFQQRRARSKRHTLQTGQPATSRSIPEVPPYPSPSQHTPANERWRVSPSRSPRSSRSPASRRRCTRKPPPAKTSRPTCRPCEFARTGWGGRKGVFRPAAAHRGGRAFSARSRFHASGAVALEPWQGSSSSPARRGTRLLAHTPAGGAANRRRDARTHLGAHTSSTPGTLGLGARC